MPEKCYGTEQRRCDSASSGIYCLGEATMLVLSRKLGETIVINGNIKVTVVKIDRNQIRIGIEAPKDVAIYREEIAPKREVLVSREAFVSP
jgi:carbon storage regulator